MRSRGRSVLAGVVFALAIAAAACGGDGSDAPKPGAARTVLTTPIASGTASAPAPCPEGWQTFTGARLSVCVPPDQTAAAGDGGATVTIALAPGSGEQFTLDLRRIDAYMPPQSCAFASGPAGAAAPPFPVSGGRGVACTVRTDASVRFSGQLSLGVGAVEFNARARDITQLQLVAAILETVGAE